jgi:MEMO1 family protein
MPAQTASHVRSPVFAGQFYPADAERCSAEVAAYLKPADVVESPKPWIGAIVPHAGWICSGAVAGRGIATLAATRPEIDVVIVFGAVHTVADYPLAALDSHQAWRLPPGECRLADELGRTLAGDQKYFAVEPRLHAREHAIEVELPFVQKAWPGVPVLPIEVPLTPLAVEIGRRTAKHVAALGLRAVFLASTDFTHYGPNYRFTPAGLGLSAIHWAMENDRRLIRIVEAMQAEQVMPEVESRYSACGGGAIAATMAACREMSATAGRVIWHTNSYETLMDVAPQPAENSVGYAAILLG